MDQIPQYTFQPGIPLDTPGDGVFPAGYSAQGPGVIPSGAFLYAVLNSLDNESIEIVRSANQGLTWQEMDATHHPTNSNLSSFAVFYNKANNQLYIAFVNANNAPDSFVLQRFSLATNLWLAPVVSTVTTNTILAVFVRNNGTVAVINEPECDGSISGLQISVLSAGVWTSYDLGADMIGAGMPAPIAGSFLAATISTGFDGSIIYCFCVANQPSPYFNACFFQSFSSGNAILNFFQFPNTAVASNPDLRVSNGSPMGEPAVSGTTIYLPVARSSYSNGEVNYPSLYVSFNSGASWSEMPLQESTDPELQGPLVMQDSVNFAGQAVLVLGQLWIVYSQEIAVPPPFGPMQKFIRLCILPAGMNPLDPANWSASTMQSLSEYASSQFATFSWPSITVTLQPPNVLLYGELYDGTESLAYWFGNFFPSIAVLPLQPGPVLNLPYCTGPNTRSFF